VTVRDGQAVTLDCDELDDEGAATSRCCNTHPPHAPKAAHEGGRRWGDGSSMCSSHAQASGR